MSRRVLALAALIAVPATACVGTDDARSDGAPVSTREPSTLSFVVEDEVPPSGSSSVTVDAAATLTVTEDVQAHSGPDRNYTVLVELLTGDTVAATGVRVETNGMVWVEITTATGHGAWVPAAALRAG